MQTSTAIKRRLLWAELRKAQINPPAEKRGKIIYLEIRKLPER